MSRSSLVGRQPRCGFVAVTPWGTLLEPVMGMQCDPHGHSRRNRSESSARVAAPCPDGEAAGTAGDDIRIRPTAAHTDTLRALIPIDATSRSRWPLRYALAQHNAGCSIAVHLIHVAEPVSDWQALRFRTQVEMARFHAMRAELLLEDAAGTLRAAGVAVTTHFREGDIVTEIVNASEQMGCQAIVLPPPYPGWRRLFARDIVREVMERATSVEIDTVDASGAVLRSPNAPP